MNNIHILPTDKPSRLHLWTDEKGTRLELCGLEYSHTRNTQHIYITSDEEIKEGDWILDNILVNKNPIKVTKELLEDGFLKEDKKIILTTDQELIKDGVQDIPDEFLEWFVNNPSCEEVKVEEFEPIYGHQNNSSSILYKIIIQKEEPKQETLEEAAERLKGKELFKESNDRARKILSEIKSLPIQERSYSEEEVIAFGEFIFKHSLLTHTRGVKSLFEQFKKK